MTHTRLTYAVFAALCALSACTQLPPPATESAAAAAAAAAKTLPAAAPAITPAPPDAGPLLHIDAAQSLIAVTVRRGGILARLGHDHVVASHTITGTVSPSRNVADFQFRLDDMKIDEADLRRIAGLEKQPSADAIEGTRHNMLTKVLDAERYPLVLVHVERPPEGQPMRAAITLHGVTRSVPTTVAMTEDEAGMTATGNAAFQQSEFGITPFSVMGGAMAVQDLLEVRFTLRATRQRH